MITMTFKELYLLHEFSIVGLARQAEVTEDTIRALFAGQAVSRKAAEAVLAALSLRTGRHYTLANVAITLVNENAGGSVVT